MLERILPERADMDYRGHPLGYWLFVLLTIMTVGRSLVHVFAADGGAQSIATIPLDQMTGGGAEGVVGVFAQWGLSQLLLAIVFVGVLVRYRGLLPLMYLIVIVEYVGRFLVGQMKPIPHVETPPGAIANLVLPLLAVVGLWLSTRRRDAAGGGGAG